MSTSVPEGNAQFPWKKRTAPTAVKFAAALMWVGAFTTVLTFISQYSQLSGNRDQVMSSVTDLGFGDPVTLQTSRVDALASLIIVSGLVQAGCWLWMAFACRRGRTWARGLSTVFFGAGCLIFAVECVAVAWSTILTTSSGTQTLAALPVLIGLLTTILLWSEGSGPHFRPAASR